LPVVLRVHGEAAERPLTGKTPWYGYRVIRSTPHDRQAFTQGLFYADGCLYEGTGLHGRSSLRKVDLASGRVLKEIRLAPSYFGEGITALGDRIVQVTWQSRVGFVYDKKSLRLMKQLTYSHEGWGITHDGKRLIMSDGTPILHLLDPTDFHETATLSVFDERGPVAGLNELEYVQGAIHANVWPTDHIVVIDPGTGRVTARIDLKGLLNPIDAPGADVLNGIAYDAGGDRLFVTGKLWPKVFELKIVKGP
jgi:glutamine cyclotransferase